MLWDQHGTQTAKIEKILISPAILLGFLHSLASTIQCKANKTYRLHQEGPIGLCAVKNVEGPAAAQAVLSDVSQHPAKSGPGSANNLKQTSIKLLISEF